MLKRTVFVWAVCVAGFFALRCSDDTAGNADTESEGAGNTDSDNTTDSTTDDTNDDSESQGAEDTVKGSLNIPADFDGSATLFSALFFSSPEGGSMPDAFGDSVTTPDLQAGTPFEFSTTQAGLEGEYYLMVVLYCEGGGNGTFPVAGVDWVGAVGPLALGPSTGEVDAGQIELMLSE